MKFSDMNKKELKAARDELRRRMIPVLGTSRVTSIESNTVFLEGGTFPATYDKSTEELSVWGRGSRYSGGSMTVAQLQIAEAEVRKFFNEYKGGE